MIEVSLLNESPIPVEVGDVDTLEQSGTPAVDATLTQSGAAADAKKVGDDLKTALMQRSNPSTFTSLAGLTDPGFYYINKSTSKNLTDCPVYDRSCRLLNIRTPAATGTLQILADCNSDKLFFRVTTGAPYPDTTWLDWKELRTGTCVPAVFPMLNIPRDISNGGYFAATHTAYGLGKSHEGMLDLNGAQSVTITWDSTGVTTAGENNGLMVFWYNASFTYLGATPWQHVSPCTLNRLDPPPYPVEPLSNDPAIPSGARYAIMYVLKPSGVANGELISIVSDGDGVKQIKAAAAPSDRVLSDGFVSCTYEVEPGVANAGRVMLPPNYDPLGKPAPVIVFVHGSGSFYQYNSSMSPTDYDDPGGEGSTDYSDYWAYLRDCGYAIIDCWGWTTKYETEANAHGLSNPYCIPTSIKAYHTAINFFLRNFNLDGNNMFVMCKSLGGHMAQMLLSSGRFKAGALLAPALAYLGTRSTAPQAYTFGYTQYIRAVIAEDLGLEDDPDHANATVANYIAGSFTNEEGKQFWTANLGKIAGFMPNWKGLVGNSAAEKLTDDMNRNDQGSTSYSDDTLCMTGYPPVTIWASRDDDKIKIKNVEVVIRNIQNAGQYAKFRVMPDNTGKHHSVDSSSSALKNESDITTALGIMYEAGTVPLAYVEAEQFLTKHRV